MRGQLQLEVDARDPLAPGLHEVLRAIDDPDRPMSVDDCDVSGPKPAVVESLRGLLVLVVRPGDPVPLHLELSLRLVVPGRDATFGRNDAAPLPPDDQALPAPHPAL